jgi:RNA polymerase sigma-70 factor (ECF subfamily)
LEPAEVEALYAAYSGDLLAFLVGVLRDGDLAREALQATFARLAESGHSAQPESMRGWLFRVAFHEALALRRTQGQHERLVRKVAWDATRVSGRPEDDAQRSETVERVRQALDGLPPDQATVVRMRIYEQQKFAEIAEQLGLPLGTVLTRMRLAMQKLGMSLEGWEQ